MVHIINTKTKDEIYFDEMEHLPRVGDYIEDYRTEEEYEVIKVVFSGTIKDDRFYDHGIIIYVK